jgi:hypothetical protein
MPRPGASCGAISHVGRRKLNEKRSARFAPKVRSCAERELAAESRRTPIGAATWPLDFFSLSFRCCCRLSMPSAFGIVNRSILTIRFPGLSTAATRYEIGFTAIHARPYLVTRAGFVTRLRRRNLYRLRPSERLRTFEIDTFSRAGKHRPAAHVLF